MANLSSFTGAVKSFQRISDSLITGQTSKSIVLGTAVDPAKTVVFCEGVKPGSAISVSDIRDVLVRGDVTSGTVFVPRRNTANVHVFVRFVLVEFY